MNDRIKTGVRLEKSISPVAAWGLSFGCAVGWGAFVMPGTTFLPLAGPMGTALGLLIGGMVMLVIAANYHYMICRYPDAGGTFAFVRKTLAQSERRSPICTHHWRRIVWQKRKTIRFTGSQESPGCCAARFSFTVRQEVADWTPIGDFAQLSRAQLDSQKTYRTSFMAPAARILMVDDTEMNQFVIRGLLKNTEMLMDTALDGKEGLTMTEQHEYDLLLIDHRMPVMDGVEMLKALRGMEENPNRNKPCIVLTANAGIGAREEYRKIGFDEYMVKPVKGKLLEQMLLKFLPPEKVKWAKEQEAATPEEECVTSDAETKASLDDTAVNNEALMDDTAVNNEMPMDDAVTVDTEDELAEQLLAMGIDMNEGIGYAGTKDMYLITLRFFRDSAEAKLRELQGYYDDENWENYVTKVHGLKSSARVIGAETFSEHARLLELAGKEGDLDYIHAQHTGLMEEYRTMKESLAQIG